MSQYDLKLVRFYIDIYIRVCFSGHNLGTFYARKLKFDNLNLQLCARVTPGHPLGLG